MSCLLDNARNSRLESAKTSVFSAAVHGIKKFMRRLKRKEKSGGLQLVRTAEELENALNEALEAKSKTRVLIVSPADMDISGPWSTLTLHQIPQRQSP